MSVENITFQNGYLVVTEDGGRKRMLPFPIKIAQVVMALLRLLMESGQMDDTTLVSEISSTEDVTLQSLLDKLIDTYGAEYENESAVTKNED